jgi:hypothetical protein
MLKELFRSQTWLEERGYGLLRYHGVQAPSDINLHAICETFHVDDVQYEKKEVEHFNILQNRDGSSFL